jgi:hypothetical protein
MATFSYPKPFEFDKSGGAASPGRSTTPSRRPAPANEAPRSASATRTNEKTNIHSQKQQQRHRTPDSPHRVPYRTPESPIRDSKQPHKVSMSPSPSTPHRRQVIRTRSNDDDLFLASATHLQRGLGPKTKSGRILPKPAPSLPIRGVQGTKSGSLELMQQEQRRQLEQQRQQLQQQQQRSTHNRSPSPNHNKMQQQQQPPASPMTPNGANRKLLVPQPMASPMTPGGTPRKPSSLTGFFRSRSRSRSQHGENDIIDDDGSNNDADNRSVRSASSRGGGFRAILPLVNLRIGSSNSDATGIAANESIASTTAIEQPPSAPSQRRQRVQRHRRGTDDDDQESASKGTAKRHSSSSIAKPKSFQQLLGKAKPERGRSSFPSATTSTEGAVPPSPRVAAAAAAAASHGYDDDASSVSSASLDAGRGSGNFFSNVLDTLYDSYVGNDNDDNQTEEQQKVSRFQMSISSLLD